MDEFRVVLTILSMVLGLGVARLLLGLITVFRTRTTSPPDWLPLAWAGFVFYSMLQYWWAVNYLSVEGIHFNFASFVYLVIMTLFLFVSAALVLPNRPEDEVGGLRAFFDGDGRYALLSLAAFLACGAAANVIFFDASLLSVWAALDVLMIAIPCAVFLTTSRRPKALLTAAYLPLCAADLWVSLGVE